MRPAASSTPGSSWAPRSGPAEIAATAQKAGLDEATTTALVDDYETAQIQSLKAGLLATALLALVSLAFTRDLPHESPRTKEEPAAAQTTGQT